MELHLDATPEELKVFLAETDDLLQMLEEALVEMEREGSRPDLIQPVFRAAHTIKGSAGAIGHSRMAALTHTMETVLDQVRRGELQVTSELIEQLFQALDQLRVLAVEVEQGQQGELDVSELVESLEQWASANSGAAEVPAPQAQVPAVRLTEILPPPDGATHHLVLAFEATDWMAVRALQALLAAEEVAEVVVCRPTRAQIEAQQISGRLEAWLQTDASMEELRQVLANVPETSVLGLLEAEQVVQAAASRQETLEAPAAQRAGVADQRSASKPGPATVRIDVSRLDNLLNLVGELVIDRTRLLELGRLLREEVGENRALADLAEATMHLGRVTDSLQAEVMKSRMLPIGTVFNRFPRVTRDLATRQGKRVDLIIEGQETELDRSVIEEIGDPVVHLLRNAVDHGLDTTEERLAAGKPETGTIRLAAEHVENSIVISVEDDGRGIDPERIKAHAVERGILSQEAADRLNQHEIVELVFTAGFSTAAEISDISGRGVGMDIVRTNVERLGGTVQVQTKLGEGTRFLLRLPLTLAIVQALLVRVRRGVYALPLTSVTETLRIPWGDVQRMKGQEAVLLRGQVLPIVRLSKLFQCADPSALDPINALIVAVKVGERQVGLVVDELLGEQEVVIKALGQLVGDVPGISSAAILGDGTVALIVDVPGLVQRVAGRRVETEPSMGDSHEHQRSLSAVA